MYDVAHEIYTQTTQSFFNSLASTNVTTARNLHYLTLTTWLMTIPSSAVKSRPDMIVAR